MLEGGDPPVSGEFPAPSQNQSAVVRGSPESAAVRGPLNPAVRGKMPAAVRGQSRPACSEDGQPAYRD